MKETTIIICGLKGKPSKKFLEAFAEMMKAAVKEAERITKDKKS